MFCIEYPLASANSITKQPLYNIILYYYHAHTYINTFTLQKREKKYMQQKGKITL